MKLSLAQLELHLKKNISSIYIISGEEIILKRDAIMQIRKAAKLAGFHEYKRVMLNAELDEKELYHALYANSLFEEKCLLELDLSHHTPTKAIGSLLQEYANNPSSNIVLLMNMEKIDEKIRKNSWYSTLEKNSISIAVWPIPREQLPVWIKNRAKKYRLQINEEAITLLADYVEGNLVAAQQAIEKLYLLQTTGMIDIKTIQSILPDESRFTVFEFVDYLIAGEIARALHTLDHLQEEGIEPTLILWGIARELRLLAEMATQIQQGCTCETLLQKHRIYARRQSAVRYFLSTYSAEDCWRYLKQLAELDKITKGVVAGNSWQALQLFCLKMI